MRVMGIDPGTATTGYGLIEKDGTSWRPVVFGTIETAAGVAQARRLKKVYDEMCRLLEAHPPDGLAVERLFFNKNVRTALTVGQARGVMLLCAAQAGLEVAEYTPPEVKQAVTGHGGADKRQVGYMVARILGLHAPPTPDDVSDALAIAVCHANTMQSRRRWADSGVWRA